MFGRAINSFTWPMEFIDIYRMENQNIRHKAGESRKVL